MKITLSSVQQWLWLRSPWLWPAAIALSAIAVVMVVFGNAPQPLRPVIAFWFLLVCPGMALVRLLRLKEALAEWILAIALSLAIEALVAGLMVFTGLWSPGAGLAALVVISLAGALLQLKLVFNGLVSGQAD